MHYYNNINTSDPNGSTSTSGATYLDRTLAHEFTHAVMGATIKYFSALPTFIKEGMAELTHGIDDERYSTILTLANSKKKLKAAVTVTTKKRSDDYYYAGGYIFLRWLAKYISEYDPTKGSSLNDTLNNSSDEVEIYAYAGKDKIINSGNNVTITGGAGADSITLNGSAQTIQFGSGDGKDVVTGFEEGDKIKITSGSLTNWALSKKNVVLTFGKGNTINLKDAKDKWITIEDTEGNVTSRIYGNGTITMAGTSDDETVSGFAKADSISALAGNDTLIGGTGADSLTGGDGADVFYYSKGDGADWITDYTADDTIVLNNVAVSKVATVKKSSDLTFTVTKGSIRLVDGAGKHVTFKDTDGNVILSQQFGTDSITVTNDDAATINASIDGSIATIDGSARINSTVYLGNAKANYISSAGDSTITTGKGKDTVDYISGNSIITDYAVGADVIKFHNSISKVTTSSDGKDLIFATSEDESLTLTKMAGKKITIIDKDGVQTSQIYGKVTLAVANADGDTVDTSTNEEVKYINGAKRTKSVYLIGNANDNTIRGGSAADTLDGGSTNDSLISGGGNDLFIFSGGNDTIYDYAVAKNNSDQITLASGINLDTYTVDGKNVIMTFKGDEENEISDKLTIINGKDKSITVNGTGKTYNDYYEKIFTKNETDTYVADTDVATINAANNNKSIDITANAKDNLIKGSAKADTIRPGGGNDSIVTNKGADLIIYSGGDDTITDYTAGADKISLNGYTLTNAEYTSAKTGNLILTVTNAEDEETTNTITIVNGIAKKTKKKINIDGTAQIFDTETITFGAADGDTIDLTKSYNSSVKTVNASGRKAAYAAYIIGNTQNNTIKGGGGADTIIATAGNNYILGNAGNDSIIGTSTGSDTLSGGAGNDTINAFGASNLIQGDAANDYLSVIGSANTLTGGAGDDTLVVNGSENTLIAGAGNDSIDLSQSTGENLIKYTTGEGNDVIVGYDKDKGDIIKLASNKTKVTKGEVKGDDYVLTIGAGTITFKDAADMTITVETFSGDEEEYYDGYDESAYRELFADDVIAEANDLNEIINDKEISISTNYNYDLSTINNFDQTNQIDQLATSQKQKKK